MTGLLVCTASPQSAPVVVVADGSYETADERVFWLSRPEREVLRMPIDAAVSVRPLQAHIPQHRPSLAGEQALSRAVAAMRTRAARSGPPG